LSAVATRLKRKEIIESDLDRTSKVPRKWRIDEIEKAFKFKEPLEYKAGTTIYCEGNISNHIFFIKKGEVKTFKINQDGKELITEIYSDKDFFGFTSLLESSPYVENAESTKDTKILRIKKNEFFSLINNNPQLGLNFIDMLSHDLEFIKDHLMHLVYDSVRRKTADAIIQLQDKRGGNAPLEISRSDLASFLGIAKETLTRTLTDFKEENLIDTQKNEIRIKNREKLQKIQ